MIISPAYFCAMAEAKKEEEALQATTSIITEKYFKAVENGDVQMVKEIFGEKRIQAMSDKVE